MAARKPRAKPGIIGTPRFRRLLEASDGDAEHAARVEAYVDGVIAHPPRSRLLRSFDDPRFVDRQPQPLAELLDAMLADLREQVEAARRE